MGAAVSGMQRPSRGNPADCEWITKGYPLCLIGDCGTGKSHLLIALGIAAATTGHHVRYTTAASR